MTDLRLETFEDHYRRAFGGLRTALIELFSVAGADPSTPQDVARGFRLNRGLTWKVSRIVSAADPFDAYSQIPGSAGIAILQDAFRRAGAPRESVDAVGEAAAEFERMIEVHAGDRATLELMIDSCSAERNQAEPLEMSRKLAFRGNSGIRGLQARARIRTTILAPNAEAPHLLDLAQVSGLVRLRRLRANAQWPLFVKRDFNDDGSPIPNKPVPLFPGDWSSDFLLTEHCSLPLPSIRVVPFEQGTIHELGEGPVGNSGVMDLVYGSLSRRFATRYRDDANRYGECFADINAPVESVLFDLVLHEELAGGARVEAKLFQGEQSRPLFGRHAVELPCPEEVQRLGPLGQGAATSLMPRYHAMLESVFDRLEWDPARFEVFRLELRYPPMPAHLLLRFPLEEPR